MPISRSWRRRDHPVRGLGDCSFEPANEAWSDSTPTDARATAFSATWEGAATICRRSPRQLLAPGGRRGGPDLRLCPDAPCPPGLGRRPATRHRSASSRADCTLSMLFSDWDASGRRDLRMSQRPRTTTSAGKEQLWQIAPGSRRVRTPRPMAGGDLAIFGMGIASQDLTGDGLPRGLPHQPGRQQAANPRRGCAARRPTIATWPEARRQRDPAVRRR